MKKSIWNVVKDKFENVYQNLYVNIAIGILTTTHTEKMNQDIVLTVDLSGLYINKEIDYAESQNQE